MSANWCRSAAFSSLTLLDTCISHAIIQARCCAQGTAHQDMVPVMSHLDANKVVDCSDVQSARQSF